MHGCSRYFTRRCIKTFIVDLSFLTIAAIIALAFIFDFINGFHDAANAIATVVSTRVLSPRTAVAMAAFFNFVAFLVFGLAVATTIAKGIVEPYSVTQEVIFAALVGAIAWDLIRSEERRVGK